MKTAFLITARLKSTRLPKKILLKVVGKPLIVLMLDRIKHATCIDKIVICTSTNPQDDPLEGIATGKRVLFQMKRRRCIGEIIGSRTELRPRAFC